MSELARIDLYQVLHLTACGLIFDVVGFIILGFAFFYKTKESMIQGEDECLNNPWHS